MNTEKFWSAGHVEHPLARARGADSRGEYVPLVYIPGKFEKTLQLDGFLQLTPEFDYFRKKGKQVTRPGPVKHLARDFRRLEREAAA